MNLLYTFYYVFISLVSFPLLINSQCYDFSYYLERILDINALNISGNTIVDKSFISDYTLYLADTTLTSEKCIIFNGGSDYAINNNDLLSYFPDSSYSIFVYFKYLQNGILINELGLSTLDTGYHYAIITLMNNSVCIRVWDNSCQCSTFNLTVNNFYHIGFTYDDIRQLTFLYINGTKVNSTSYPTHQKVQANPGSYFSIGGSNVTNCGNSQSASICFRSLNLFNKALSSSEVSSLNIQIANQFN